MQVSTIITKSWLKRPSVSLVVYAWTHTHALSHTLGHTWITRLLWQWPSDNPILLQILHIYKWVYMHIIHVVCHACQCVWLPLASRDWCKWRRWSTVICRISAFSSFADPCSDTMMKVCTIAVHSKWLCLITALESKWIIHAHACTYTRTHIHTCAHAHTCTRTCMCTHAHTHVCTHSVLCVQSKSLAPWMKLHSQALHRQKASHSITKSHLPTPNSGM